MDDDQEVPPKLAASRIAQAHAFFVKEIEAWATAPDGPADPVARIRTLAQTLRDHLKLVVIDLEPGMQVQIEVLRNGERVQLPLTIGRRPADVP